jgi:hypothetical protein
VIHTMRKPAYHMPRIDPLDLEPLEFGVKYRYVPPDDHTYVCTVPSSDTRDPVSIDNLFIEVNSRFSSLKNFSSNDWGRIIFIYFDKQLSAEELDKLHTLIKAYHKEVDSDLRKLPENRKEEK